MAKLYFNYSTMNAGKSTSLLQASHNYREGGMMTYLLTAQFDNRAGQGRIASRIGIGEDADAFAPTDDMFAKIQTRLTAGPVACIFIDEAPVSLPRVAAAPVSPKLPSPSRSHTNVKGSPPGSLPKPSSRIDDCRSMMYGPRAKATGASLAICTVAVATSLS